MKLSTRSRYGTRLMLDLAVNYGNGPVQLKDIAKNQGISEKYLGQIIIPLKSKGLVLSERGARGGYMLAKAPEEITVKDIVLCLEGDISPVECGGMNGSCDTSVTCVTKKVWCMLADSIDGVLSSFTLSQLAADYKKLSQSYAYII